MGYYRLSEQRVRRVLHSPRRIEEGVAPKTVAMMQPISIHSVRTEIVPGERRGFRGARPGTPLGLPIASQWKKSVLGAAPRHDASLPSGKAGISWSQEIWVMVQDVPTGRKIISAWRYPGVSKVRGEITGIMKAEYQSYLAKK